MRKILAILTMIAIPGTALGQSGAIVCVHKATHPDLEGDFVEGELPRPGPALLVDDGRTRGSLIRMRCDFVGAILRSVENI